MYDGTTQTHTTHGFLWSDLNTVYQNQSLEYTDSEEVAQIIPVSSDLMISSECNFWSPFLQTCSQLIWAPGFM